MKKMGKDTYQMKKWESQFGYDYTNRNPGSVEEEDKEYLDILGITRTEQYERFLAGLAVNNVLEVGCNVGIQLLVLNKI